MHALDARTKNAKTKVERYRKESSVSLLRLLSRSIPPGCISIGALYVMSTYGQR